MFQDHVSVKGHLQRVALVAIREAVLLDHESSGDALLNRENPGGEGDVLQPDVMEEGPQVDGEQPVLRDSIWREELTVYTFSPTHTKLIVKEYDRKDGLTILDVGRVRQHRGGNGEQNLVSGVLLGAIRPPQQLQHGLHRVRDVVLVIWGMAL